uniref:hypothetical protein n=1 Tax=Agathobacter sp. TaxID=2021311 RepID=UPI004055F309
MDIKLKTAIQWGLYVLVAFISIMTLAALVISMIGPMFFPKTDISGVKNYINIACTILSFLSVGLGFFSIWQANQSGKQTIEMMQLLQNLEKKQSEMMVTLKNINDPTVVTTQHDSNNTWTPDTIID